MKRDLALAFFRLGALDGSRCGAALAAAGRSTLPRYSIRAHGGGGEVGPRAGEFASAVAREAEKERGAAWAGAQAPSTTDAVAIIQRARGGDLHAVGVIFGWREQGCGRWLLKTYPDLRRGRSSRKDRCCRFFQMDLLASATSRTPSTSRRRGYGRVVIIRPMSRETCRKISA